MSKIADVFISYSERDHKLIEQLGRALYSHGISVWSDHASEAGTDWQRAIDHAIKAADAIIVLIDSKQTPSRQQQFEWSATLEAEWEDQQKKVIPVLLRNAELPSFLSNRQVLRVGDPAREWPQAMADLIHLLKNEPLAVSDLVSFEKADPAKQHERLRDIKRIANDMKLQYLQTVSKHP